MNILDLFKIPPRLTYSIHIAQNNLFGSLSTCISYFMFDNNMVTVQDVTLFKFVFWHWIKSFSFRLMEILETSDREKKI